MGYRRESRPSMNKDRTIVRLVVEEGKLSSTNIDLPRYLISWELDTDKSVRRLQVVCTAKKKKAVPQTTTPLPSGGWLTTPATFEYVVDPAAAPIWTTSFICAEDKVELSFDLRSVPRVWFREGSFADLLQWAGIDRVCYDFTFTTKGGQVKPRAYETLWAVKPTGEVVDVTGQDPDLARPYILGYKDSWGCSQAVLYSPSKWDTQKILERIKEFNQRQPSQDALESLVGRLVHSLN